MPRSQPALAPRRRTLRPAPARQARAVRTRTQLVAAARGLLGDRGLAGAPTAAVAVRARVSHGALFRHFPHKTDLLLAVTEAILADLRGAFAAELGPTPTGDPLTAACAAPMAGSWP